ncbi:MAG TPA: heme NO-binding domain-containing protein, partial [bacterium]|nr:heme NO-binding domain-containing protein [bacterium]
MHGIVFLELRKFVEQNMGKDGWRNLLKQTEIEVDHYMPSQTYPDSELYALVASACSMTGQPVNAILEAFGKFMVPNLVSVYGAFIDRKWGLIDVLENIDKTIHNVVRRKNPGALPPALETHRIDIDRIEIVYRSERKMCSLGKGLILGLSELYRQNISYEEPSHRGTRRQPGAGAGAAA